MAPFESVVRSYAEELLSQLGPELAIKIAQDRQLLGIVEILREIVTSEKTAH